MENKYDKLIELLNQYEIDRGMGSVFNIWKFAGEIHYYDNEKDEFVFENVKLYIISKQFGFIKWLIDNDKIDLGLYKEYMPNLGEDFSVENNIIMNLSIARDPIGYLNYILK